MNTQPHQPDEPVRYDNAAPITVYPYPLREPIGPWVPIESNDDAETLRVVEWTLPGGHPPLQLGLSLPETFAFKDSDILTPEPFTLRSFTGDAAGEARVFAGSLFGHTGPIPGNDTPADVVGAELRINPGAEFLFVVDAAFEHAVLAVTDGLVVENVSLDPSTIGVACAGTKSMHVFNKSNTKAVGVVLGGASSTPHSPAKNI